MLFFKSLQGKGMAEPCYKIIYQDFNPIHADFLQKCISTHETKQSSKY